MSADKAYLDYTKLGGSKEEAEKIRVLIEATEHVSNYEDNDCKYIQDIDLSILGSSVHDFKYYEEGIKDEYMALYPLEDFVEGRKDFLKNLLTKKYIYHTDYFINEYEYKARTNILNVLMCYDTCDYELKTLGK